MNLASRIASQSPQQRRALALLLIPVATLIAWLTIVMPLRWIATSQEHWHDETRAELARMRGYARSLPTLRSQLARLPGEPVWQRFYSSAVGEDIGTVVQHDVSALSAGAGFTNHSIVALPSEQRGRLMAYAVRLTAVGTAEQLKTFATNLRSHSRYLRAERLNVTAPQAQSNDDNAMLTLTLDIVGFARESVRSLVPDKST